MSRSSAHRGAQRNLWEGQGGSTEKESSRIRNGRNFQNNQRGYGWGVELSGRAGPWPLGQVAPLCLGEGAAGWIVAPREDLREGWGDALLAALGQLPSPTADAAKLVATTCTSFDERCARRDAPRLRAEGDQIGSGLAERPCKRRVSQRETGPGMHWPPWCPSDRHLARRPPEQPLARGRHGPPCRLAPTGEIYTHPRSGGPGQSGQGSPTLLSGIAT